MASIETFDWVMSDMFPEPTPEIREYLKAQREYMLTLRSEDERQRFVEALREELRDRQKAPSKL